MCVSCELGPGHVIRGARLSSIARPSNVKKTPREQATLWCRPGGCADSPVFAANVKAGDAIQKMDGLLMRLPESVVNLQPDRIIGQVIHVDRVGNAITGITRNHLSQYKTRPPKISLPYGADIPLKKTYAAVSKGKTIALINSSDHLEIAIHAGNASLTHGLTRGSEVKVIF